MYADIPRRVAQNEWARLCVEFCMKCKSYVEFKDRKIRDNYCNADITVGEGQCFRLYIEIEKDGAKSFASMDLEGALRLANIIDEFYAHRMGWDLKTAREVRAYQADKAEIATLEREIKCLEKKLKMLRR